MSVDALKGFIVSVGLLEHPNGEMEVFVKLDLPRGWTRNGKILLTTGEAEEVIRRLRVAVGGCEHVLAGKPVQTMSKPKGSA